MGNTPLMVVADLAQIEARALGWAAGQWDLIEAFIALDAAKARGASEDEISEMDIYTVTGKKMGMSRSGGKIAILAGGYQAGRHTVRIFAKGYGIDLTEDQAQDIVNAYREANQMIVKMWKVEEDAAKAAVNNPEEFYDRSPVGGFLFNGQHLLRKLPSERCICYRNARIELRKTPWGQNRRVVCYDANYFAKGTREFVRLKAYGGLFCLAGDTKVLTPRGWVPLVDVLPSDHVWDGDAWVTHAGLVLQGEKETSILDGVRMTPDHEVLTAEGWRIASSCEGYSRPEIRTPYGSGIHGVEREEVPMDVRVRPMWEHNDEDTGRSGQADAAHEDGSLWVPERSRGEARHVGSPSLRGVAIYACEVQHALSSGLEELRRQGYLGDTSVARILAVLDGYGAYLPSGTDDRSQRQQRGVFAEELPLGDVSGAEPQSARQPERQNPLGEYDPSGSGRAFGHKGDDAALPMVSWGSEFGPIHPSGRKEQVYDLMNAGPRRRFTVMGDSGPMIVHNCENLIQAMCRDILAVGMFRADRAGLDIRLHVHDEIGIRSTDPERDGETLRRAMTDPIKWCSGLPISSSVDILTRYRKA